MRGLTENWSRTGCVRCFEVICTMHKPAEHTPTVRISSDKLTEPRLLMLSQTFCYWDKQQSPGSNIIQLYLTLKWTIDQSSHFYDRLLASNWTFHNHDRGVTKIYAGSEQSLTCVVINISHHPAVKTNNPDYHAFGKYWMQARGLLLKFCWKLSTVAYMSIKRTWT